VDARTVLAQWIEHTDRGRGSGSRLLQGGVAAG